MPVRRRSLGSSLFLILILAACAPKPAPEAVAPAVDSAAVRSAVAEFWQRWTAGEVAGDAAALAEMVTDSVRIDMKGAPTILGREAWKTMAEAGYKNVKYTAMNIQPENTAAISNDLAYERGSYTQGATAKGKKTTNYGRYAGALRRGADGTWRVSYIMVFADSTVPAK